MAPPASNQEGAPLTIAVLDASAVLAVFFGEAGADMVVDTLPGSLLSAVNYTEVIGKCLDRGDDYGAALRRFAALGVVVVAHDTRLAQRAGELRPLTKKVGLSLADRACLALCARERLPALTADRSWSSLPLDIEIRLIR